MRKICVVTGSRAEYGLLSGLMAAIKADKDLKLQVIATNMHLSPEFGLTYREIEKDGFKIDKKVEMLLSSDTSNGTTKSVGLGIIGFADAYEALKPDIIVVLGDRYEILAAVSAALFYKIPVAHIHGGEITEGAYDDCIRHAITKMSHLHFTSTEEYRRRVIQLGEQPDRVFNVGALGVENIKKVKLLSKLELEKKLNFNISDKCFLVTYHPVTLSKESPALQFQNLLSALDSFNDYKLIFTYPNSDTDGRIIIDMMCSYVKKNKYRAIAVQSLGQQGYLSTLKYITAVVGNSSSGIIEVPSFGLPTLDIGDRQKGRIAAQSVIHCGASENSIKHGLTDCLKFNAVNTVLNPYEQKDTTREIIKVLKSFNISDVLKKSFYDISL